MFSIILLDYLLLSGHFTPIPQVHTHWATKISEKYCVRNWYKNRLIVPKFRFQFHIQCFPNSTGLFVAFWSFHTYSTGPFLKTFHLHCVQNWAKNGFAGIFKCYPLILWQSIKISVRFHKSTHQALPFWLKRISGTFPNFPEKLTLSAKFGQKWFWLEFEVLPPDYLTVNQNFSPIPQIYTSNTTILITKNFWKIFQFSRKTYIVCQIGTR